MRQFLRVLVVVLIMIGLGFGTYSLFFKPANKDEIYLTLSEVPELIDTYKYEAGIQNISSKKFYPIVDEEYDEKLSEMYINVLNEFHPLVVGFDGTLIDVDVEGSDGAEGYTYYQYSYPQLKLYMDEIFGYYFAYSQAVSRTIPKSRFKEVNAAVSNYENALSNLTNNGFAEVESLQTFISQNKTEDYSKELVNRYRRVVVLYREYIASYAKLIDAAKEFVIDYVFSGEMITDRESLLYELMIDSLSKALSGGYDFENVKLRKISDDYMNSATKFVELAMAADKNGMLQDINMYDAKSVMYTGGVEAVIYAPKIWNYYKFDVNFKLGKVTISGTEYDALYLENSNIVVADESSGVVEITDAGVVTINADTMAGDALKPITKQSVSGYVSFTCYIAEDASNRIFFYENDNSHYYDSQYWINLQNPAVISGSQVVLGSEGEKVSYIHTYVAKQYYEIDGRCYELNEDNVLATIGNGATGTLDSAVYYANNFYSATDYNDGETGEPAGEPLNYKRMIKCYNKIVEESPDDLDKLIDLTYEEKIAFVQDELVGDIRVRANFVEVLHEEMEYLLACCGFYSEVE